MTGQGGSTARPSMAQLSELHPKIEALDAVTQMGNLVQPILLQLNFFFCGKPGSQPAGSKVDAVVMRGLNGGMIAVHRIPRGIHSQQEDASCQQEIIEHNPHRHPISDIGLSAKNTGMSTTIS